MVVHEEEVGELRAQAASLRQEIAVLRERLAELGVENAELRRWAGRRTAEDEPWVTEWACEPSGTVPAP